MVGLFGMTLFFFNYCYMKENERIYTNDIKGKVLISYI